MEMHTEDLFYKSKHRLIIMKTDVVYEDEYILTIYNSSSTINEIKINIINVSNDLESYTSLITPSVYGVLKSKQELIIEFNQLCVQMKALLTENLSCENNIILRLNINDAGNVELGFFKKSNLKELTLLIIPFEHTGTQDIIKYIKNKYEYEKSVKEQLKHKYQIQETEIETVISKYRHLYTNFNTACEKLSETESLSKVLREENTYLKQLINRLEDQNKQLTLDLEESKNTICKSEEIIHGLKKDIGCLRLGIDYYSELSTTYTNELKNQEHNTVPKGKYMELRNVFCSAVVDLVKYQVSLSKLVSLNQLQKSENVHLQTEISGLMNLISNLEESIKTTDIVTSDEIAQVRNMIEQLELQNPCPGQLTLK